MIVTQATQNTRLLAYFSAFPGSQNPAGAAAQDLSEVAGRPRGGRGKPPFGYLLAPPLLTDTTAVTGDSQWLLRLFTRDVHTWGTRVYPQLAQYPLSETPDPQKSTNVPSTYPVRNSQLAAISG